MSIEKLTPEELKGMLAGSNGEQSLLLNAYLEEEKRWAEKLKILHSKKLILFDEVERLKNLLELKIEERAIEYEAVLSVTGLIKNVIGKSNNTRYDELTNEIDDINKEIDDIVDKYNIVCKEYDQLSQSPPELFRYELAMLGNQLFKPRNFGGV